VFGSFHKYSDTLNFEPSSAAWNPNITVVVVVVVSCVKRTEYLLFLGQEGAGTQDLPG
jgi:hypothetical protein